MNFANYERALALITQSSNAQAVIKAPWTLEAEHVLEREGSGSRTRSSDAVEYWRFSEWRVALQQVHVLQTTAIMQLYSERTLARDQEMISCCARALGHERAARMLCLQYLRLQLARELLVLGDRPREHFALYPMSN